MNVKCPECGVMWPVRAEKVERPYLRMKCDHCKAIFIFKPPVTPSTKKILRSLQQSDHPFFSLRGFMSYPHINIAGYWSYPAFIQSNKNQIFWLHLILSIVPNHVKKITGLFRPRASVITTLGSKTVVCIKDFWAEVGRDPFDSYSWDSKPVGIYPHETIKKLSTRELKKKEKALLLACEAETTRFENDGTLSKDFCHQWRDLSHPVFAGFLNTLAPDFIKALETGLRS